MTMIQELDLPETSAPVLTPSLPTHPARRRRSRRTVLAGVAFGLIIGTTAGYVAFEAVSDSSAGGGPERALVADTARLQAQADAFTASQDALALGRQADAARLQAQADAFTASQDALVRGRQADAARWQGGADAFAASQDALVRGRQADAARLQAQADAMAAEGR